jgi:hypothetical protein
MQRVKEVLGHAWQGCTDQRLKKKKREHFYMLRKNKQGRHARASKKSVTHMHTSSQLLIAEQETFIYIVVYI